MQSRIHSSTFPYQRTHCLQCGYTVYVRSHRGGPSHKRKDKKNSAVLKTNPLPKHSTHPAEWTDMTKLCCDHENHLE